MTSKVYRPEMSLYRDGQFWPSGKIPMVGAGSFNQHLDPCFTNSAPPLPPPISKLSTPDLAESLLEQGQTRDAESFWNIFYFFLQTGDCRAQEKMCFLFPQNLSGVRPLTGWGTPDSSQFLSSEFLSRNSAGGKLEDLKRGAKQCNVGLLDSRADNCQRQEIRWKSCWQKKIIVKDTFF